MELPSASVSAPSRAGAGSATGEIDAADWFDAWQREEMPLQEPPRKTRRWEFEGRDTPDRSDEDDEFGLEELDGQLRWPGKSRRR